MIPVSNLGLNKQYFNYRQNFTNTTGAMHTVYESSDVSTCHASGGLLLGYQKLYQTFGWGVEGRGIYNANSYADTWDYIASSGGGVIIHNKFKIPCQFDLVFKPMLIFGHDNFAYIPFVLQDARFWR